MKATELMIGDWVYVSENFTQKYHKVRYIGDDGVIGCLFVNEYGIECKSVPCMDCVQPIPITKEILENNGFRYDEEEGWEFSGKDYEPLISCVLEECFVQIESNSLTAELHIQYVHELQRALRCCGLWDLAEKFKI